MLADAFEAAWDLRAELHGDPDTDVYRLLDGMYEGAPGWTVDRFGDAVSLRRYARGELSADESEQLGRLVESLQRRLDDDVPVFLRQADRAPVQIAGVVVLPAEGDPLSARPGRCGVRERGLRFGVDMLWGQNPGLFADAREARQAVRDRSEGRRILNLFSYTSAFGVAAAVGGARSTTNVDVVLTALERGRANYGLNGLPDDPRAHLRSEGFEFVKRALKRGETWDGVVVDPPPVRTRGKRRGRGWDPDRDLPRLVEAVRSLVSPGGWLLVVSAVRGRDRFEDRLDPGSWIGIPRGADFPGPLEQGMRGLLLET